MKLNKNIVLSFCALTALVTISNANQGGGKPQGNGTPPKEAISACKNKEAGTTCTMSTPRGDLEGQCMNTPDDKYFVCMPEGGPNKR